MKYLAGVLSLSSVVLALGCDGGDDASTRDGGGGGSDATVPGRDGSTPPPFDAGPVETRSVTAGPFEVGPRGERTQCLSFDLGNEAPMMVRAIRTHLTEGSHHMIVYHVDEPPDPTPRNCGGFSHGVAQSLFIAQQREASIVYPPGSALPIDAHQTIALEIHYINYVSDSPISVSGTVELDLVPVDEALAAVQLLFTGDFTIDIPARDMAVETSFHPISPANRVFALTSHTHQLGELATIHRGTSLTDVGEELHRSTSWAEPPLDFFDPPLTFAPGEGLVLTCHYYNPNDYGVGFGTEFDDEMCFLWVYFIL